MIEYCYKIIDLTLIYFYVSKNKWVIVKVFFENCVLLIESLNLYYKSVLSSTQKFTIQFCILYYSYLENLIIIKIMVFNHVTFVLHLYFLEF